MRPFERAEKCPRLLNKRHMSLCYLSKRGATTTTPVSAVPPPAATKTVSETNVYYAYTTLIEAQTAAPCSGPGEIAQDLEATGGGTSLPACTRVRLHYPMQSHGGATYMLAALLCPDTAQFSFGWIKVYTDAAGPGGTPQRHVTEFQV